MYNMGGIQNNMDSLRSPSNNLSNIDRNTGHLLHLDFLRIVAIFLVVFNHTGTRGFLLFTVAQQSPLYGLYSFLSIADKMAVPIFWMISGALLLNKEEPISIVLKKRVLRFAAVLILFSFVQYLFEINFDLHSFSMAYFVKKLYTSKFAEAYWYLYAYLGYLLSLPFLRKMVRSMENKDFIFMTICVFVINLLPILEFYWWGTPNVRNSDLKLFLSGWTFPCAVLGYYFEHRLPTKYFNVKTIVLIGSAAIASIVLCCVSTYLFCTATGNWAKNGKAFDSILAPLPAAATYLAAKSLFLRRTPSNGLSKAIRLVGGTTFGIMLIENLLRKYTEGLYDLLYPYIRSLPACIIWVGVVCILGSIITLILKRVPVLKKLL